MSSPISGVQFLGRYVSVTGVFPIVVLLSRLQTDLIRRDFWRVLHLVLLSCVCGGYGWQGRGMEEECQIQG